MDYRERGFHARGVYPIEDISRMGTARVKQEEEANEINGRNISKKGSWARRGKYQTRPN